MESNTLTPKQKIVLDFITSFVDKNGYSPSLEEISKYLKLRSISTVHQYVGVLERKGYLSKVEFKQRSIEPVINETEIPLLGYVAAGEPIEAISNPEPIKVPQSMLSKKGLHYGLKIKGNSMVDDGIYDGDIVVIKQQVTAQNGQRIVALINGNEATLKKIYREKNGFRLQPANSSMKPIFVTSIALRGAVVGIIRKS